MYGTIPSCTLLRFSELRTGEYDFARCMRPDGTTYGSRGKCRKGTQTATPVEKPTPKKLKGQALANAMMHYTNIENRVRANNKGSLTTKKARLELETELKKAKVPNKVQLREMALAQRQAETKSAPKVSSKALKEAKVKLSRLVKELEEATSSKQVSRIEREIKKIQSSLRG